MPTILDRLFGRPTEAKAVVTGNGGTGPGVVALTYDVPLDSLSKNPQKMAAAAQRAYHENIWVHAAEWAIVSRATSVGWHLEDDQGDTIGDEPGEEHPALDLLLNPAKEQFGRVSSIARRRLQTLTLRHMGLCGYAFWYLDQRDVVAGIPAQILYINPARMVPATDKAGNLIGWIMDPDRPNGRPAVAFEPDEILPFILDPDDDGWLGIGLVEAAWTKIRLSKAGDVHATKTMGSGGRKPGIIMPTTEKGSFTPDEYAAIVREMRNVTDSPDAAKKSLIFKAPVDYKDAGTTPEQLQLVNIMQLSREDVVTGWGVPLGQLGIPTPRGLNGGEAYKGDEAVLWQGPIKSRLDVYSETVQTGLLDRFAALGQPVTLVLHQPTFDDNAPLYEIAEKSRTIALTNDERRALVGLPPLGVENGGNVIYLPQDLVPIGGGQADAGAEIEAGGDVKARLKADTSRSELLGLRKHSTMSWEPKLKRTAEQILADMRDEIARLVEEKHAHLSRRRTDTDAWFDEAAWTDRFAELVKRETELAREVNTKIDRTLKREGKAGVLDNVLDFVKERGAVRIKGILDTTRELLQKIIGDGLKDGMGPAELGRAVREATAFDEARAELIARTEAAYAYNDAAATTYRSLDVKRVQIVDGDHDDICADANGSVWTLDEFESNPLGHPNCTRDAIPLLA